MPLVFESGELFHQPCLPDLPGSLKDQRLAIGLQIPLEQVGYRGSFHGGRGGWGGIAAVGRQGGVLRNLHLFVGSSGIKNRN